MLKKILIPMDGSGESEAVLGQVRRLLHGTEAQVILFRASPRVQLGRISTRTADRLAAEARDHIDASVRTLSAQGVRCTGLTRRGDPAKSILATAADEDATLIAMTTHGRGGLARWIMGSVADQVVRSAAVPVLLCRSHAGPHPGCADEIPFRRILVPVGGSAPMKALISAVRDLAVPLGAETLVLHASPAHRSGPPPETAAVALPMTTSETGTAEVDEAARRVRNEFAASGVSARILGAAGEAAPAIVEAAEAERADLIAMVNRGGRAGIDRWDQASVTQQVLRTSTKPLLVVRSDGTTREAAA